MIRTRRIGKNSGKHCFAVKWYYNIEISSGRMSSRLEQKRIGLWQKGSGWLIANNIKAYFDFFIDDKVPSAVLPPCAGQMGESMRMGKCSVKITKLRITNDRSHDLQHAHQPRMRRKYLQQGPARRKTLMHRYGSTN